MLGSFLASRRARLRPDELGLPVGLRRTPGLRREEVAVLAGVSVSWYTWLEQGRDIQASADTLRRVAEVLRLDRVEAEHLFALSAREPPQFAVSSEVSDGLQLLVEAIDPVPAYVRNARLDILSCGTRPLPTFLSTTPRLPRASATRCACCSYIVPTER